MCATRARDLDVPRPREDAVLRPMAPGDLDAVEAIERATFSCPWSRESFRRLVGRPDADTWVAERDGRVLGYAVVWYVDDEGELGNLAVAPDARGRGLGGRLLDAAIARARARGARRLFLEVRVRNARAQALYRSRGFVPIGVRPRYYRRPTEDAIVMCLELGADEPPDTARRPVPGLR
jgi:ribosomal-protein-alanine N-acetyltransferase